MALNFKDDQEIFGLKVDERAKYYLLETMRWTKFMGIIFAIMVILICMLMTFLFTIYLPKYMQTTIPNGNIVLVIILLIICSIHFFPIFSLLKFGAHINKAIKTDNQDHFILALKYLKNLFMYVGIATIAIILLYGVSFTVSALSLR